MNRALVPFLLLTFVIGANAQSGLPSYVTTNTYLNNYVQPSPNIASLGKYADYPVSYYTGVPDISISLFNLQDGAANMPISISYHGSGIKVAETASWVGLGWALNAGGMITRSVRGAPDEGSGYGLSGYAGPTGYYKNFGLSTLPMLPYPSAPSDYKALNTYPPQAIMAGYMDTEPDLFTFNFNGMTGKFVFDENQTVHLLTDDNLLITPTYDGTTFTTWSITDANGVKYFFGENSAYEVTLPSSYMNNGYVDRRAYLPSSWYLTRVVYPNTKDTVYLNYTPEKYLYRDLPPESTTYDNSNLQNACINFIVANDVLQTTVNGQRLTSITSKNYNILLAAHTNRQDLLGYSGLLPYTLDSVNIYTSQGLCLQRYVLGHSYFISTTGSTTANIAALLSRLNDATDTKRLKLTSLTEYSGDGTIAKPAYNFNYYDSLQLPRRLSYDQDDWGYSNNYAGNTNNFFTPPVTHPICTVNTGVGANRTPKWPDEKAFSLINMVDPLGVVTNFVFEGHGSVGGLRIQKITATDSVTGLVKIRSFSYDGGAIFNQPVHLIVPNNEYYQGFINGSASFIGYSYAPYTIRNIIKQSQSIVPLQDVQGNAIGYGGVRETFGARGEGGSTYYQFQTNGSSNEGSRLDMYNYAGYGTYYSYGAGANVSVLTGNGLFNGIAPESLNYHLGYNGTPYYPYTPNQISLGRGRLGSTLTYDSAGVLLHSVTNSFSNTIHENYLIRGLKAFRTPVVWTNGAGAGLAYWDAFSFYKLHTGISHILSNAVTDYKDGKAMTTVTNYVYESPYHTLKTGETTVNSTGDTVTKKTYYSFDYSNAASPDNVFAKMNARHILAPVSTRTWKNNTLIGGMVTQYKDYAASSADTFINPSKAYSMETTVPLSIAQAGENIALTGQFTALLPDTNFVEKADYNFNGTTGRVIEQKLVNDKSQAFIWDNQLRLPLAKVDNASFADVAYCSFETAEAGNWSFTSSAIVSDVTAPTGGKAYAVTSSAPIAASGLTSSLAYLVSYWSKSGASISITGGTQSNSVTGFTLNGWTYNELTVTGTTTLSITGTGSVDEVRLYPATAQMLTYTYDANFRLIATCAVNSLISYYEYDALHRLTDIKDQNGNVIKAYEYNYGRQSR